MYAASQDKELLKIDLHEFEVVAVIKKAHAKMFDCAGLNNDSIVTVSHPCSEIALWDKDTLEKKKDIRFPLKLSGTRYIDGDELYISSRNICGISSVNLNI